VDEASGIIMFTKSDGAPFGVQLSTVFHDVLTVPFQVSVSISLLLNPTSKLPKAEGNKSYQCRKANQSVVLALLRPCSDNVLELFFI
jgi:hypothetical protein